AGVGERAHFRIRLQPIADLHSLRALGEALQEGVVDAALDIEAGWRDADLAGVAELLRHDHVERLFKVAIVEDQHRRMAAKLHGDARHAVGGEAHQVLADIGRAGERSEERRVGKECRSRCDWSSDVCSSDLKISTGAWPPSSMVMRVMLSAARRIRCLPTLVEPVKLTLRMVREAISVVLIILASPWTS